MRRLIEAASLPRNLLAGTGDQPGQIPDRPFFSKSFADCYSVSVMSSHSPSQTAGYRRDAAVQPQRVGFAKESTGRKNPLRIVLSSSANKYDRDWSWPCLPIL